MKYINRKGQNSRVFLFIMLKGIIDFEFWSICKDFMS